MQKENKQNQTDIIDKRHRAYIPSFSNVDELGLLRLLTNVSSLNDDGIVPLQFHIHTHTNIQTNTIWCPRTNRNHYSSGRT